MTPAWSCFGQLNYKHGAP